MIEMDSGHAAAQCGQVVIRAIDSKVLRGNRPCDPTRRAIPVYLPPSYDNSPQRRYPTIYMLNGYSGTGMTYLNLQCWTPNLPARVDRLIEGGHMKEAIIVMADGMTRYGGSQYIDSPATGRYQTFLADETVAYIDASFRTIPQREARGLIGKSSGGYGALVTAMQRSDVFSAAACHSGDMYFEYVFPPSIPKAASTVMKHGSLAAWLDHFERQPKKRSEEFDTICTVAMASCYSPSLDDGDGFGFLLPFDPKTGAYRDDVFRRWLDFDPVRLLERHADALRGLRLLFVDVGDQDEFNLHLGARILHARMEALDITHRYEEFHDGHRDVPYRYSVSLPLVAAALADG